MPTPVILALDAMGGDQAPDIVVAGATLALQRFPEARLILFGDEARVAPLIARHKRLDGRVELRHTADVVSSGEKPSVALRTGRRSSMRLAIDAVAAGEAGGIVSAGNTGALMAMSKIALKTLPGIDRPAIATAFPTERGESVMLDLGANVECDAENLVQFALMGEAFARTALGRQSPTIGLLNVGSEEQKGHEAVRQAAAILRSSSLPIHFHGFIEGDDIPKGTVDVVVTDGFSGNIALKTAEGTAKMLSYYLRQGFRSSLLSRLGFLLARGAMQALRHRLDPRRYNGAVLLGLNGIVVKSHGGTDALGFANAIGVGVDMAKYGFLDRLREELAHLAEIDVPEQKAATS